MPGTATFVGQDNSTGGNWVGVYASQGYYKLEGGTQFGSNSTLVSSLPANVTIPDFSYSKYNNAPGTTDARGVRRVPPNQAFRDANSFFSATTHYFTIAASDSAARRVRILLMDYENAGRSTRVDIVEAANPSNVLDTRTVPSGAVHTAGTWLSWDFTGSIQIRCVCLSGGNSTSFMLAFDDAAPADTTAPTVSSASVDSTGAALTVNFSESVTGGAGFTLSGGRTLGAAAGSGSFRTFAVSPAVNQGETVTLSYAPGNVADAAGNQLATFSGQSVTNNSTVVPALSPGTATGSTTAIAASVAATAASGGTGPYAYQWYGSTTSGFTPGSGNLLSGQTGQNLSNFAVAAGSTWYFVRRATDSAGTPATAFTSQFTYTAPGSAAVAGIYRQRPRTLGA